MTIASNLFQQVSADYRHSDKHVQPAQPLDSGDVFLKWYLVHPPARPFAEADFRQAQDFIQQEIECGRLALKNQIGFVVQHRCAHVDIFYVCNWRNNNEVWEALYTKAIEQPSKFQPVSRDLTTGTFCVWVIPIVAHEQQAWRRYLTSTRDKPAQLAYARDQLAGMV